MRAMTSPIPRTSPNNTSVVEYRKHGGFCSMRPLLARELYSTKYFSKTMTIPEPRTITDAHGNPAFVQLPAEEWAAFVRGGTAHE
jgi:hypothetical protein